VGIEEGGVEAEDAAVGMALDPAPVAGTAVVVADVVADARIVVGSAADAGVE
jgi:hypothetical protein